MEAAQCSVKNSQQTNVKFLDNQSGNFLVVFAIIALIGGTIGYFMTLNSKVDTEVRSLGATQRTVYMKSDVRETIRKTLMGTNKDCPSAMVSTLRSKFIDFNASIDSAKYKYTYKWLPGPPPYTIDLDPNAICFLHQNRYLGIDFRSVTIDFLRASEPNLITLSSFVTVNVNIGFVSGGKSSALKYALRYRVDVLTLNHFGLISISPNNMFNIVNDGKVDVEAWTLLDQDDRLKAKNLESFVNFPDTTKVQYNKKFWMAAPKITLGANGLDFMKNKKIDDVFRYGIDFAVLPSTGPFEAPYEVAPDQWNDTFNYDIMDKIYVLPKLNGGTSAISSPTMGVIYKYNFMDDGTTAYNESDNKFTSKIYEGLYGNKNQLFKSCDESTITGQFNLLIFNNFNEDFVIDFSGNTDVSASPPVFCGLIAARSVTFILNDKDTDDLKHNHFIGKIIVKDTIRVQNKGELHIHDIMEVTNDKIGYGIADLSNVKAQFYNQKYFSSQNFQLPFFKDPSVYGAAGSTTNPVAHYLPRATKVFFDKDCAGFKCRKDEIDVPVKEALIQNPTWNNNLLFEVFSVE